MGSLHISRHTQTNTDISTRNAISVAAKLLTSPKIPTPELTRVRVTATSSVMCVQRERILIDETHEILSLSLSLFGSEQTRNYIKACMESKLL